MSNRIGRLRGCVCIIPECGKPAKKMAFCENHYMYYYRRGRIKSRKHGMYGSIEYTVWLGLKIRCFFKRSASYKRYGGAGIIMDIEWYCSFKRFFEDMGKRPGLNYQLDRINPKGNYIKENCRWLLTSLNRNRRYETDPF